MFLKYLYIFDSGQNKYLGNIYLKIYIKQTVNNVSGKYVNIALVLCTVQLEVEKIF